MVKININQMGELELFDRILPSLNNFKVKIAQVNLEFLKNKKVCLYSSGLASC